MPILAVSTYQGGSVEDVTPLARRMRAILLKYGVSYRAGCVQTAQDAGGWIVVVQYADWAAYAKALESFQHDPEHRQVVAELSKFVTLVRRELVVEVDLDATTASSPSPQPPRTSEAKVAI